MFRLLILFSFVFFNFTLFAEDRNEMDFYNHSNDHGALFRSIDNIDSIDNVSSKVISEIKKCGREEYKRVKKTALELKESERPFWVYKNCYTSRYVFNSADIHEVYRLYRFQLASRIKENWYSKNGSIVSYLPVNIEKGKDYVYYFGMRNKLIDFSLDNNKMTLTLPFIYSGIITDFIIDEENKRIEIYEIYLKDRPSKIKLNRYEDRFEK